MKFTNKLRLLSFRRCLRAGMATGLCVGFLTLPSAAPAQDEGQDQSQDIAAQIEDRLRPSNSVDEDRRSGSDRGEPREGQFRQRVEDALNGRPSPPNAEGGRQSSPEQELGQPYYRDAQGRFFFLDPQGGRVYIDQQRPMDRQRPAMRVEQPMPRPEAPQGPELGIIITDSPQGIRVDQVQGGSVADEAGIQPGDVLQQVDGQRISDPRQLQRIVQSMSSGDSVELTVLRNGEERTVTATFSEESERGSRRYGSSRPALEGAELQQEVRQLRREVQALRQQMNQLRRGQDNGSADSRPTPPPAFGEAGAEATETERDNPAVRARSSEKIDLSADEEELDAATDTDAESETDKEATEPESVGDDSGNNSTL